MCVGCELCDLNCLKNSNKYCSVPIYSKTEQNFNISFKDRKIEGKMILKLKKNDFNHASCNCESYYKLDSDSSRETVLNIDFEISFVIDLDEIKMEYVPKIVM